MWLFKRLAKDRFDCACDVSLSFQTSGVNGNGRDGTAFSVIVVNVGKVAAKFVGVIASKPGYVVK